MVHDVTQLLHAYRDGDRAALDRVVPIVYEDLRRIARAHVRKGPSSHTLHTQTLIHEVYLRLVDASRVDWEDRQHFLAVCARAMRQVVISNARKHRARKRGGDASPVTWDDALGVQPERAEALIELDEALERLAARDPELARIVECRFFAGFTEEETAEIVGSSLRTVQRDWKRARAWLREDLSEPFG